MRRLQPGYAFATFAVAFAIWVMFALHEEVNYDRKRKYGQGIDWPPRKWWQLWLPNEQSRSGDVA